jgi:hypothetical protein
MGNDFLKKTLIAQDMITRVDKWNCIKLKSFCIAKDTISRVKRQPTEQELFIWIELEIIMLTEISQPQKYRMFSLICRI